MNAALKEIIDSDKAVETGIAAAILGCTPKMLVKMRSKGGGGGPNYVKIGRLVRYRLKDLYRYLDQNTVKNTA